MHKAHEPLYTNLANAPAADFDELKTLRTQVRLLRGQAARAEVLERDKLQSNALLRQLEATAALGEEVQDADPGLEAREGLRGLVAGHIVEPEELVPPVDLVGDLLLDVGDLVRGQLVHPGKVPRAVAVVLLKGDPRMMLIQL